MKDPSEKLKIHRPTSAVEKTRESESERSRTQEDGRKSHGPQIQSGRGQNQEKGKTHDPSAKLKINRSISAVDTQGTESERSNEDGNCIARRKYATHTKRPFITYEAATWAIFLSFTILAIADRFTTNVSPRQTFSIGGGSAGSDRMEGYKPGPWSVVTYDIIARISGRFSICCFNLLLVTRLRSLEHMLSSSWVGKYVLDCTDIINANLRLHRWNAIALCILTFIHVWSILLPCVTHGYSAQVVPGTFEYPLSERKPNGFKDADPETKTMSLQVDDVYRMVEMTILLCILTPLSVHWLSTRWHVGMPLHRSIMVLYFVDIVRRHTHPHSWVLNTPVFVIWLLDKVWSTYWRRCVSPKVHRVKLGDNYMALFWNGGPAGVRSNTVGADYSLRMNDSSFLEGAHVFTTFENRLGLKFDGISSTFKWSVGTVIRVYDKKRVPQLGKKDPCSHTKRMYDTPSLDLTVWGPTQGEMSDHVRDALLGSTPVVLVAAGSGIGYTIDALQWASNFGLKCSLKVLFTTRSESLAEWAQEFISKVVSNDEKTDIRVVLALTHWSKNKPIVADIEKSGSKTVSTVLGRIDFRTEIDKGSLVFCQGSQGLKDHVSAACREQKAKFYGGLGGS